MNLYLNVQAVAYYCLPYRWRCAKECTLPNVPLPKIVFNDNFHNVIIPSSMMTT